MKRIRPALEVVQTWKSRPGGVYRHLLLHISCENNTIQSYRLESKMVNGTPNQNDAGTVRSPFRRVPDCILINEMTPR